MESLLCDLRAAVRMLRRYPGFSTLAVTALALGIGANAAIFSVIRAAVLNPLPYRDEGSLAAIWESNTSAGVDREPASSLNFSDWRAQARTFEGMAASGAWVDTVIAGQEPEQMRGADVTENFFPLLGVTPVMGRGFVPSDFEGPRRAVLLTHELWMRAFGGDRRALGATVLVRRDPCTVVGILPRGYRHPDFRRGAPPALLFAPATLPQDPGMRRMNYLSVIGRLRPATSIAAAQSEMSGIARRLALQYPGNAGFEVRVTPLKEALYGDMRRPFWILLGAVGVLLAITCANVANLLLVRMTARQREFAVRAALGGGRARLVRQLLAESLVLSTLGGALGVLLARGTAGALVALGGAYIPRGDEVQVNLPVLLFTLAVSCAAAVLFGSAPAFHAARLDIAGALGDRSATAPGHNRLRQLLSAAQVALAVVLLVGAGLLLRSFARLRAVDFGFQPGRVLTALIYLPQPEKANDPRTIEALRSFLERVERIPGVAAAGAVSDVPLNAGPRWTELPFNIEGQPARGPADMQTAIFSSTSPGYFRAMGIPLRRGRYLESRDAAGTPRCAVVNETFVRRHLSGCDPLGRRVVVMPPESLEIVGVVGDVRQQTATAEPKPQIYVPHAQLGWPSMQLVVRARTEPAALVPAIRQAWKAAAPGRPMAEVRTAAGIVSGSLAGPRFSALLVALFAGLALLLAAIGIYGVVAFGMARRTREIGVRMALGARPHDVLAMVLREGAAMAAAGLATGILMAAVLARFLASLLYGIGTSDPLTFAAVATLFLAVVLTAVWIPARRAMRVDPVVALREQ